jgi:hypothetical protein
MTRNRMCYTSLSIDTFHRAPTSTQCKQAQHTEAYGRHCGTMQATDVVRTSASRALYNTNSQMDHSGWVDVCVKISLCSPRAQFAACNAVHWAKSVFASSLLRHCVEAVVMSKYCTSIQRGRKAPWVLLLEDRGLRSAI